MASKWLKYKDQALQLRKEGLSIRKIEQDLGIARSTLSGWFNEVRLSPAQKKILLKKWQAGLQKAREKAALWHTADRQKRLKEYSQEAEGVLDVLNVKSEPILELALAMLYLGEGAKKSDNLRVSNSSPLILKTLISILQKIYKIDVQKIKCSLNLRADQDPEEMKRFWSHELKIPLENFTYVYIDKRTSITKTYAWYKGVCMVRIGTTAMKERLMYVANGFCERVLKT